MTNSRWQRMIGVLCLVLAAYGLSNRAHSAELSSDALRDLRLRPGVVLIFVPLRGSIPELGITCPEGKGILGSGFIFRPDGYIITNGHVAQLANAKDTDARQARQKAITTCLLNVLIQKKAAQLQQQGLPMTPKDQQKLLVQVAELMQAGKITIDQEPATVKVCLDNQQCVNGEIKAYSDPFIEAANPGKDVAIIKVDGHDLPTVPFGDSDALRVNDGIEVIGYPGDASVSSISTFVATSTTGTVSAVKRLDRPDIPILQTSAIINPGNSGGPAFDSQGRVIGIATFKSGEAYNYLVPLSVALEFVHQAGVEPTRGAFDALWEKALQAFSAGHWTEAHKLMADVLEMMPEQPEAKRLEREAAKKISDQGPLDKMLSDFGGLAGIALLVVVAGGLLAWFLMRNKGPKVAGLPPMVVSPSPGDAATLKSPRTLESSSTAPLPAETFGSLHISAGPLAGNRFPIPKSGLLIGRDASRCAIVIPEDAVSGEHSWVVPLDNGVVVIDRNSSNGTYINNPSSARVSKVLLRHGDRIYLGSSTTTVLTYFSA